MKKILAFGASSSKKSINKQLATYAAHQIENTEITILDLNDFAMPIYSIDKETDNGIPELALKFKRLIKDSDGMVISFAEHNGAYSAAFKNIMDWNSRIEKDAWVSKPMLLLATSPGPRGGAAVLDIAVNKFKFMNTSPIQHFSLPSFYDNFNTEKGITDGDLNASFNTALTAFHQSL